MPAGYLGGLLWGIQQLAFSASASSSRAPSASAVPAACSPVGKSEGNQEEKANAMNPNHPRNDSDNSDRRRARQQQQDQDNNYLGTVAGAVAAGVAGAAVYYVAKRMLSGDPMQQQWKWPDPRRLFWKKVEEQQTEEVASIESVFKPEAKYRHKYNKYDTWFQNLMAQKLRISDSQRRMYKDAFEELLDEKLLPAMKEADLLFNFLYRDIRPAGSSFEDLRICTPDEYDVNVILFPPNVDEGIEVVPLTSGHIGLNLGSDGFIVKLQKVVKKLASTSFPADHQILNSWLDKDHCIRRTKVLNWMKSVVDSALNIHLRNTNWTHIERVTRSTSGPAITLIVVLKSGKKLSIDLVPAIEFSVNYLPRKEQNRVREKSTSNGSSPRTWYAIPKGSKTGPENEWRTSLYEMERDLMNGHQLLKPCIRIMKRLRDEQKWKGLSSYYIKTMFMWMMEDNLKGWGLGRMMMHALETLERSLRSNSIRYYWDDGLNLLDNVDNPEFFRNVANHISHIVKIFERSLNDDSVDPMRFFGFRSETHPQLEFAGTSLQSQPVVGETNENENCLIM